MTTWGGAVLSSGGVRASTDAGELRRRREPRRHAFEHGAEFGVADVAQAVSQLGGYGFQHGRRLNGRGARDLAVRSEEHTSELQSLMRISYAVFCLKKKK